MMKNNLYPFYLSVFGIILIIISPSLLSDGMFLDGLLYAVISKNLANGIGDFGTTPHQNIIPIFLNILR